jgi:hypothetical protein
MSERKRVWWVVVPALAALLCGCGSSTGSAPSTGSTATSSATGVVWLCRPGVSPDPCTGNLATTAIPATGTRTVQRLRSAPDSAFDCFYVYPTVSTQPTTNANLEIQAAEIGAAASQAAPFSSVCRVYAPIYRQRTVSSLTAGLGSDPHADAVAYASLLAGWNDYLTRYNDGRPVVFIGHSQGAAMLIRLLSSQIDDNPGLRSRMVSAIIAGGNVAVPDGADVGSTFQHLALCTSPGEDGCVIAYSSFPSQPPLASLFGRPGTGVSLQSGQTATAGVHVACVNPAALGGGTGTLVPLFLSVTQTVSAPPVTTPWVTYPELYTASCQSSGGATWLQVDATAPTGNRPTVTETLGPDWGYHVDDINLAAGNLVDDVQTQETTYEHAHP